MHNSKTIQYETQKLPFANLDFNLLLCFSCKCAKCRANLSNSSLTFEQKMDAFNPNFQNKAMLTHKDSADLKKFARWSRFWKTRTNPDGTSGYTAAPQLNFQSCSSLGDWKAEGCFEFPQNANGVGRIQAIAVYEQNHHTVRRF
ncbi:MAG: hypothetical protein ACI9GM_001389 [Salibacteraceae bacterium]|jgi:hypothetical protein